MKLVLTRINEGHLTARSLALRGGHTEVQAVLLLCRKAQSSRRSLGPETEHALVEARALADRQPGAVLRLDVKQKGEAMLTLIAERDFKVHLNILRFSRPGRGALLLGTESP
ncbi:hypothetical protein AK812_SmicGene31108 [Symbiodinium microadriaticum]|uniref:Uncharacterized protein n=1 Tax=Symbiodinium microadriaticum TaxID=2951 RepID=A0A1Q9CXI5_SYMMI|nr:hypothetical protein AK812_SmicGene31108 [Symbiodinium microadriaticum]CAE7944841.1 unnamed protein product [Symbiodinium sp. KB8]